MPPFGDTFAATQSTVPSELRSARTGALALARGYQVLQELDRSRDERESADARKSAAGIP
jgi:hypothetical protein